MIGFCITLPSDLYEAIKIEAFNQSKSMSLLIHEILQYAFTEEEKETIKK
jgi:hypothetical protein